ncbi:dTDP-4-dehydrorhamnose reductase [Clavibacter capsici]|uniref:dTDP-4-dehydrorhamnose reductase n=1 Tax=Clavibacter capsici TaxID=1874630 RepID=UPI0014286E42|nr:dTDP-4-dehydrorhamnose reductase [Clavibacter capsici]QIS41477.1 dTDP-4-dehydrorhamnose reductase [Clavibacter capsici]
MSRVLVTGGGGMLGRDLLPALAAHEVTAPRRAELDITDEDAVRRAVAGHDVVVNLAAYTAVDAAEEHEDEARAVNATGPGVLARAAAEAGARIVHVSTDYVFDGSATSPYPEDAPHAPVSAYGRTKAEGERLVLEGHPTGASVVRTAWLYGAGGPSFPSTMLRLAASHDTVSVVDDQRGQPTWTVDLAARLVELVDAGAPAGVFHGTGSGETTWHGLARAVFAEAGLDPERVLPTDSASFVRPAPRPAYSVLGHDAWARVGLPPLRDWREALSDAAGHGVLRAR